MITFVPETTTIKHYAMRLYHGSSTPFTLQPGRCLYLSAEIKDAKEYALGIDVCGNYNEESYIYAMDIDEGTVVEIEDFAEFDASGYTDYDNMPDVAYNPESGWYCVKNPANLTLVEHYRNQL